MVLRLDEREGQIAYNVFRNYLIDKMKRERVRPKVGAIRNDCEVCNHILENTEFEAIINNEFIKLDSWSRRNRYSSRVPTCKIISVKEPKSSIDVNALQVVERVRYEDTNADCSRSYRSARADEPEEFVQTLVSAGLADPEPAQNQHQLFFRSVSVVEIVEVSRSASAKDVNISKNGTENALSFAF